MKEKLLIFIAIYTLMPAFGQEANELPKIVPLSPNAAAIAKYGEIPISYFTGVPNISIPIYTIQSGKLTLPLFLSYHAGGNRVESVATWVGLGWSLGTIPSISRSVQGIPDENGGYFSKFSGKTVKELWEQRESNTTLFNSYRSALYNGSADSEPDIFYYNLPDESGKFFYNQEEDVFITFPKSNTKITRNGNTFILVTQSGIEYNFNVVETSTTSGAVQGDPIRSTWYASTIKSASEKNSIRLTYQIENQIRKGKNVVTKYHYLEGLSNGYPSDNGSILTTTNIHAMVVDSIIFDNGYVKFNKNVGEYRADLKGGYSLNNVSVYNNDNQLISKHNFVYRFKQGTGTGVSGPGACYGADSYSRNWMLLDKIEQVPTTGSGDKLSHSFTYDETYFPACRYSAAQDYWGYYNGKDSNPDLTPSYYLPNSNTQISGADRGVDRLKSKFGILKRITYPTGGYTEFDFENNETRAKDLPPQYVSEQVMLAGDEFFDIEEPLAPTFEVDRVFVINNPPDAELNNNNPDGGAIVSFEFFFPGCDLSSGHANECARFTVSGPSLNTTDITIYGANFYLPNGTYTLKASFNQPDPNYQDFIFIAKWKRLGSNQATNTYAGGLRCKEIRSYKSTSSQPITKRYKYTTEYNSTISSGDVFNIPNFSHTDIITYQNQTLPQGGVGASKLLRVRSVSNIQQVSHSGSFVGYAKVFEETDNIDETGYKEYHFSNARDEPQDYGFPYPPAQSMQLERGKLLIEKGYKRAIDDFDLLYDKHISYTSSAFNTASEYPKSSFAVKWGNLFISEIDESAYIAQTMVDYNVFGGWDDLFSESNTNYYSNGTSSTSTQYYYDNPRHLLKTRTKTINSKGERFISTIKYPQDIINPSGAESKLILQNRLGEVIETESYRDINANGLTEANELLSKQKNTYKDWGSDVILPEKVLTSKGSETLEPRIEYKRYDSYGNPEEVKQVDGPSVVYLWGYNGQHPIAKIENVASYSSIPPSLITAAKAASNTGTEADLIARLNNIRDALPHARVTTYTYKPLIGVSTITSPSGKETTYSYDDFNRLEFIRDEEDKLLEQYKYHYKN